MLKDDDIVVEPDDEAMSDDQQPDAAETPAIPHHPDLIDDYDRFDYVAVDGRTLVAEYKFSDGTGIKAWTHDQGKAYATRHLTALGRAILRSGQSDVNVEAVNAEIESLAAERNTND